MLITTKDACARLLENDNILIFAHHKPDGDTLGAAFALMWALLSLGKKARVKCTDDFPAKYNFIYGDYKPKKDFDVKYVVAVDIASRELIGDDKIKYADNVDLCIDHHKSNTLYAKETLLDAKAAAACEIIYDVIKGLGVNIDVKIADAIFTGLSTDTGCFKYTNVTGKTHRIAADMIEAGANHGKINKLLFDTKSRGMLMVDRMMIETTQFYLSDKCALSLISKDIGEQFGVSEEDLDGISSFPIRIEDVLAGVTVRVRENDTYRVSLRTVSPVDASRICAKFGGGGHLNAAGCTVTGACQEVINRVLAAVEDEFKLNEIT